MASLNDDIPYLVVSGYGLGKMGKRHTYDQVILVEEDADI